MIHLGCCAFNFNGWTLEESLRLCRDLGFDRVDAGGGQVGVDQAVDDPVAEARRVRELATQNQLQLSELFLNAVPVDGAGVQPSEEDAALADRMVERFKRICDFSSQAGFRSVMGAKGKLDDEASRERAVNRLNQMADAAKDHGLQYTVEIGGGDDVSAERQLVADVPGLRYTLDYAHSLPRGAKLENVMQLHDLTAHIHAKPAYPGRSKAYAHLSTTDWETIFADLKQRNWDGDVVVECIAYPVDDPRLDRAAFVQIDVPFEQVPVDPGPLSHPAFQTMRLAYDLVLALEKTGEF